MLDIYTKDTVLGSAKWWEFDGLNDDYGATLLDSQFIIGKSTIGKKGRVITNVHRHLLTVAPTRSGKSASLILPNLLHSKRSAVVIDPKGELAFLTAKRRRELGQRTFVFDPFGEVEKNYGKFASDDDQEPVTCFNPFENCSGDDLKDYVRYISEALILVQGDDPHWGESSLELTEGLLAWTIEDPDTIKSLPNFRSLLTQPLNALAATAVEAQLLPYTSIAKRKLGRFTDDKIIENKELCSIISTAITQTAFLDDPELNECLSSTTNDFSFDCLTEDDLGATIYLVLPFDKLQSHGRWLRLMVSLAIRTVFRCAKKLKDSVLFVLDEFGTIGPLPAITNAFSMGAGRQMLLWAFVQGLPQIKRDYPAEWEIFIANCDHVIFFNIMDEFSAKYLSDMLGNTTVSITQQNGYTGSANNTNTLCGPCFQEEKVPASQYYSRCLLQPSEIRQLPEDYGVLVNRNKPPVLFEKIKYFDDDLFKSYARKDPYYPTEDDTCESAPETETVPDTLSLPESGEM